MAQKPREISDLESMIIQIIREHLGVSQRNAAWLVENTGMPKSTLSKTLNGLRATDLVELQTIAEALGLRLSEVVAEAERALSRPSLRAVPSDEDFYRMAAKDGGREHPSSMDDQ